MPLKTKDMVTFDPRNPKHVACIGRTLATAKLDPEFRFHCEEPYTSVVTMAVHKMAECWIEENAQGESSDETVTHTAGGSVVQLFSVAGRKPITSRKLEVPAPA